MINIIILKDTYIPISYLIYQIKFLLVIRYKEVLYTFEFDLKKHCQMLTSDSVWFSS